MNAIDSGYSAFDSGVRRSTTLAKTDNSKFHNNGPIGERDYEDNLAQVEVETRNGFVVSPLQARLDVREAKVANVAKQRFALIDKLTAEFKAANGRRPLPSEITNINRQVNRILGI